MGEMFSFKLTLFLMANGVLSFKMQQRSGSARRHFDPIDDDDPPIVTITDPPSQKQVPINQSFKIPWAVTDDFGACGH